MASIAATTATTTTSSSASAFFLTNGRSDRQDGHKRRMRGESVDKFH
jgi:hypothetical protein